MQSEKYPLEGDGPPFEGESPDRVPLLRGGPPHERVSRTDIQYISSGKPRIRQSSDIRPISEVLGSLNFRIRKFSYSFPFRHAYANNGAILFRLSQLLSSIFNKFNHFLTYSPESPHRFSRHSIFHTL